MFDPAALLSLLEAGGDDEIDELDLRRRAYRACDGDAGALLVLLVRTVHDLSDQLATFYGTDTATVLRMQAYLPLADSTSDV